MKSSSTIVAYKMDFHKSILRYIVECGVATYTHFLRDPQLLTREVACL
jgi:hypothetical protein